ncbi:MAG: tetratricopeptide repeat-containing protein [Bacteroidota bacterium]
MTQKIQKNKPAKPSKQNEARQTGWSSLLPYALLLVALVAIAFSGALSNQFLRWDDHLYVTENEFILTPTFAHLGDLFRQVVAANYHPLTMWSMWLNARLFGLGPQSFIGVNIALHALNAVLVFYWVWLLSGKRLIIALSTAVLFAVHPMRVESVAWISERKDVLYMCFLLAGCIAYWFFTEKGNRRYLWLAFGFMLLSCLSKAVAVVFPLLCLLMDYWKQRTWSLKLLLEKAPMFALSLLIGLLAIAAQSGNDFGGFLHFSNKQSTALSVHYSFFQNLCFAGYSLMVYAAKTIWPFGLSPLYPYPPEGREANPIYLVGFLFGLALVGLTAWFVWKKRRNASFFMLFFWATILLVLRFYSIGAVLLADRYLYLPCIAIFGGLAFGFSNYADKSKTLLRIYIAVVAALALFWVVRTRAQVKVWANDETLWGAVLESFPENDQARDALGNYLGRKGRIDEAIAQFEKAISDGCKMPDTFGGLASAYSVKAQAASANQSTQDQLRQKAQHLYDQAFALDAENGGRYYDRALSRYDYNPEAALRDLENATQYEPAKKAKHDLLRGLCLINLNRNAEAATILSTAIQALEATPLQKRTAEFTQQLYVAYLNKGIARNTIGDQSGGISDVKHAMELSPGNPEPQRVLERLVNGH